MADVAAGVIVNNNNNNNNNNNIDRLAPPPEAGQMTLPSSPAPSSSDSSLYPSSTDSDGSPERGAAPRVQQPRPVPAPVARQEEAVAPRGGHFGGVHLFTITVRMPEGSILHSKMMRPDLFDSEDLTVGSSLLRALHGNCQQFFLSAAMNTTRQRLYSRIRTSGRMSHACELQCEFDRAAGTARVSGYALQSAYAPQAGPAYQQLQFITKHASSGALTHIDLSCIPYLGHLPTDMIGRSLFCFVYAPDVHIIRQAHIDLHAGKGRIVRSTASIRFVAFNGALIRAETEWSAYVNPWTRKMELVCARHKLVDAPVGDANVLGVPADGFVSPVLPQPMIRMLEEDLRQIMAKPIGSGQAAAAAAVAANGLPLASSFAGLSGLQAKDLSLYVERIVEAIVLNGPAGLEQSVKALREEEQRAAACAAAAAAASAAAAAAVAATNTETSTPPSTTAAAQQLEQLHQLQLAAANQQLPLPLSYNQINCLENVHRLLKSQAKYEEEGEGEEVQNDLSNLAPSIPLTRETLMEHTRRYEAEYRATWSRRLSGALKRPFTFEMPTTSQEAAPAPAPPAPKQMRSNSGPPPLEWSQAQREEYYRMQQNPAVPSGVNYQITSMPLPSPATVLAQQQQAAARRSAFSTVHHRAHLDIQQQAKSYGPLTVSTFDPPVSVIKSTEPQGLLLEATKLA